MRVTIIVDDNTVHVDGVSRTVDCTPLLSDNIHAVQWNTDHGEIEFRNTVDVEQGIINRAPNEFIRDFTPYQSYVDAWETENAKQELLEYTVERKRKEDWEAGQAELKRAEENPPPPMPRPPMDDRVADALEMILQRLEKLEKG